MGSISKEIDDAYLGCLKDLTFSTPGSDEAKFLLDMTTELHKQRMAEWQSARDELYRFKELELKRAQQGHDRMSQYLKLGVELGMFLGSGLLSSYWMGKTLTFEETGSFSSRAYNWVSNNLRLFQV